MCMMQFNCSGGAAANAETAEFFLQYNLAMIMYKEYSTTSAAEHTKAIII